MSFVGFLLLCLVLMYASKNFPGAIGNLFKGVMIIFGVLFIAILLLMILAY